jgi:hypothetical protein
LAAGCSNKGLVFEQGDLYGLESGALSFAVDPHGARIVDVHLTGAANLLTGPAANPTNFGSTFWTSPQSRWGWPPPSAFDTDAYIPSTTDASIAFDGPTATALGVRIRKQFAVDIHRPGRIEADYQIAAATDSTASSVAPWEISRVPAGGLTFFGTGLSPPTAGGGFALPPTQDSAGCTWLDDGATPIPTAGSRPDQKLLADGAGGWLAHVDGDVVLIKQFPDVPPGMAAPGEGEIEIFVQGAGAYVELEEQGPYQTLTPGQTVTWDVAWTVARLPPGLSASVGNPDLVSFVRQMLQ